MTTILHDGDYIPDGKGGFQQTDGLQALLCQALFRLSVKRGSFPFLPQLGSRLHTLCREKPSARNMAARQFAAEALDGMEVSVEDAVVTLQPDGSALVTVSLTAAGETVSLEVTA